MELYDKSTVVVINLSSTFLSRRTLITVALSSQNGIVKINTVIVKVSHTSSMWTVGMFHVMSKSHFSNEWV